MAATISHDLAWTITKGNSATLVKRANGVQFSRDPLNLRNIYSRQNEGSIADQVRSCKQARTRIADLRPGLGITSGGFGLISE